MTECLVLAELCSQHLVIALNKIDQLVAANMLLEQATAGVRQELRKSRMFGQAPIVGVSACVGGEKVAGATTESGDTNTRTITTSHFDALLTTTLWDNLLPLSNRPIHNSQFVFTVDHCFPVKGRGTVVTGTCLSGCVSTGQAVAIPDGQERKIKSCPSLQTGCTFGSGGRSGRIVCQSLAWVSIGSSGTTKGTLPTIVCTIGGARLPSFAKGRTIWERYDNRASAMYRSAIRPCWQRSPLGRPGIGPRHSGGHHSAERTTFADCMDDTHEFLQQPEGLLESLYDEASGYDAINGATATEQEGELLLVALGPDRLWHNTGTLSFPQSDYRFSFGYDDHNNDNDGNGDGLSSRLFGATLGTHRATPIATGPMVYTERTPRCHCTAGRRAYPQR